LNPDICLFQYDPIACTPQATCTTGAALLKDEASMHWPVPTFMIWIGLVSVGVPR
jgi:hypothetical protein